MKITFNGAARIVTGSCHLIEAGSEKILVDCGLFQGTEETEALNHLPFAFNPKDVSAVLLTHAHMDHAGRLPKLIKEGFHGKIFCTIATKDLCEILLLDGAHIQEEEEKLGGPLYDEMDVKKTMTRFNEVDYGKEYEVTPNIRARFRDAGHILGAAILEIFVKEGKKKTKLVFSGDMGQKNTPIVNNPEEIEEADYLFLESTYGARLHKDVGKGNALLAAVIRRAYKKGGKLFIPCFAVQRTQELLYRMRELRKNAQIPRVDVYLDSPLAMKATAIYKKHQECFDAETRKVDKPFSFSGLTYTPSVNESKKINSMKGPLIVVAGSGMCTAGRIRHHLRNGIYNPKNTVLFVGYQAEGTLGREIIEGAKKLDIFGETVEVKSEIVMIESFSGHADYNGLLDWVEAFKKKPKKVFVIHGEEKSSLSMQQKLEKMKLSAYVPKMNETIEI
jgi:metallo-beta-lactamase family protein